MDSIKSVPVEPDPFRDLLAVLNEEELIRLRRRLERVGNKYLARILEAEINKRGREKPL